MSMSIPRTPVADLGLSTDLLRDLTDQEVEAYNRDGAIVARGVIPPDWIEFMTEAVERVLADPKGMGMEYTKEDKPGRFFGDLFTWLWNEDFRSFVLASPLAALAAQVMRSQKVNFFYDQLLVKEPGTQEKTPWHQDLPYWPIKGDQVTSIWVPFDKVSAGSGSVVYIRGSHRWDKWYQPVSFSEDRQAVHDPAAEQAPEFGSEFHDDDQLCWKLEPGDCLIHHPRTVHGAAGNSSLSNRRRALAVRYAGDDATYEPRPASFIDHPDFAPQIPQHGLKKNHPFDAPLFPQVWPKT